MNNSLKNLILISLAVIVTLLITPLMGVDFISPYLIVSGESELINSIFWQLRVPRVLTAFLVGGALSLGGLIFQAMFRNSLATPYTLGIASGSSLGAALYIQLGLSLSLGFLNGISLFTFLGALASVSLVYFIARGRGRVEMNTLLLAGVIIGMFFSSFILIIQFMSNERSAMNIIRWIMGGLDVVGMETVYSILPFVLIGFIVSIRLSGEMNLLTLGDDLANSRGLNVERIRKLLFLFTSLMIAGVVAECGPIGFVGLIVPHIIKKLSGYNHYYLVPQSFMAGGIFLVLCDLFSRSIFVETLLPVGVITSLLGGPFFLYILLSKKA
jgi:iron complex transport system permease protein